MLLIHTSCGPLVDLDHLFRHGNQSQNGAGTGQNGKGDNVPPGNGELRTPNISWPVVRAATWQHGLYEIWLPEGFTWEVPDTEFACGEAYSMVYTPVDTINYRVLRQDITVNRIANSTTHFGNSVEGEMVWIPAGTFTMGSDGNEWYAQPAHQVILTQGFFMGTTEVTQAQWRQVMTENVNEINPSPSHFTGDRLPVERVSWYDILVFANRLSIARDLTPAYRINGSTNPDDWGAVPTSWDTTWNAVEIVANSTGYRLPTEAQWEYACRAETTTFWNTGDNIVAGVPNAPGAQVNLNMIVSQTTPVGSYAPNAWGLYDMHGNVWEWVWDWFATYSTLLELDPTRTDSLGAVFGDHRVMRGGGWGVVAEYARSAVRLSNSSPFDTWYDRGFRLVRP